MLPGAAVMPGLSLLYLAFKQMGWIAAAFVGLKAAVIAIVAQVPVRIAGRALLGAMQRALALAAFAAIFVLCAPFPGIVPGAGALSCAISRGGASGPETRVRGTARTVALWLVLRLGRDHVLVQVAVYFSQMAGLTLGGAYAGLAWVAQTAVEGGGWLSAPAMLDGLALAETTPGPLILVTHFMGFMAGATGGGPWVGIVAALITRRVTLAPCFLFAGGAPVGTALTTFWRWTVRIACCITRP